MTPPNQRAGKKPNADSLAAATAPGRLQKAQDVDPVLGSHATQQSQSSPEDAPEDKPRKAKASRKKAYPTKLSFYTTDEDSDRMRATWNNLPASVRPRTFSAFMHGAVMEKVVEAEEKYNGGEPWPTQAAGTIATGRPVGE